MWFGMVVRMGSGMRYVVGFGDRSKGGGNFGAKVGHPIVTNGDFDMACLHFQITLGNLVEHYSDITAMV